MNDIFVDVQGPAASLVVQVDTTRPMRTVVGEIPGASETGVSVAATQGPAGPPGPAGSGSGSGSPDLSLVAGQVLSGHRAVTLDATGRVVYANASVPLHATRVLGITTQAADLGAAVNVAMRREVVEPSWNWDVAKPVFLSTNGLLTQATPVAPASVFSLTVGFPTSPTSLFVNVGFPINLT